LGKKGGKRLGRSTQGEGEASQGTDMEDRRLRRTGPEPKREKRTINSKVKLIMVVSDEEKENARTRGRARGKELD